MNTNLKLSEFLGHVVKKTRITDLNPTFENILRVIYTDATPDAGPWIAGGCARQLVLGEANFNDIDIWFRSQYQYQQTRNRLYACFELFETYESDNATTYQAGDQKIQLIKRAFYPSIDAVFDSFDFVCCQVAVNAEGTVYGPGIEDARNMVLRLAKFSEKDFLPRYAKYLSYGYRMDPDEFLDIITNNELNYKFDGAAIGY